MGRLSPQTLPNLTEAYLIQRKNRSAYRQAIPYLHKSKAVYEAIGEEK